MGDRVTWFEDCPKCGGKGTVECYEQLTALLKIDACEAKGCDFARRYDVTDDDDVIRVEELKEGADT
jgi:hypothetical protein